MKRLEIKKSNTIISDYKIGKMFLEDFLDELEKNNNSYYDISLDENNNRYIIRYEGEDYSLELREIKDISVLSRLKKIINVKLNINNNETQIRQKEENVRLIISEAESGHLPNDEAKLIYLQHLKKDKKLSFAKLKSYFKNIISDIEKTREESKEFIKSHIWPFKNIDSTKSSLSEKVMTAFAIHMIPSIILPLIVHMIFSIPLSIYLIITMGILFLPFGIYLIPAVSFLCHNIKNRVLRLAKFINKRRLSNYKIKQLLQQLNPKFKLEESKNPEATERQIIHDTPPLNDLIHIEINKLIDKVSSIKTEEKTDILNELRKILEEYDERLNRIQENELQNIFTLDGDNIEKVKIDIIGRITRIETKINSIVEISDEKDKRQKEKQMLLDKIKRESTSVQTSKDDSFREYLKLLDISNDINYNNNQISYPKKHILKR